MQGHGRIIAHDFCVAHREANSGLSTLNRTKSILSIYHQQRQLQRQRGMCLNDTYPFCQQPLSGNCHSICFSKPVLWTATPVESVFLSGADSGEFGGIIRRFRSGGCLCGRLQVFAAVRAESAFRIDFPSAILTKHGVSFWMQNRKTLIRTARTRRTR